MVSMFFFSRRAQFCYGQMIIAQGAVAWLTGEIMLQVLIMENVAMPGVNLVSQKS